MLLIENKKKNDVYFDIDVNIILINVDFFKKQNFNVFIREIITFFIMRDLNILQHQKFKLYYNVNIFRRR